MRATDPSPRAGLAVLVAVLGACGGAGASRTGRAAEPGDEPEPEPAAAVEPAAASPAGPPSTEAGREALDRARGAKDAGDRVLARRILHRLLRDEPATVEAGIAREMLVHEALARRDLRSARALAVALPADSLPRRRIDALAFEAEGRHADAARAWLAAASDTLDDASRVEAATGAARNLLVAGDPLAARAAAAEHGLQGASPLAILGAEVSTPGVLERVEEALPPGDAWAPVVTLERARAACRGDDPGRCRETAARAVEVLAAGAAAGAAADPALDAEAKALLDEATLWTEVDPKVVGVLLPLSGDYQRIGQAALEGLQHTLADHPGIRLVVRDTAGDASVAREKAKELCLGEHAVALLGPIGEKESRAAAEVAARYGVPQVVLTSSPEAGEGLAGVFRVRLSAPEQAAALARHAVTALGVSRVALVWPENATGQRTVFAFWDEIERAGGEVRAAESYAPGDTAFGPVVQRLVAASKPGTGTFDFDGLFVPDDALSVRRLVPFLGYWDVHVRTAPDLRGTARRPAVQLLGAAGWNHPSVVDRGDGLTENAVFVDAWVHDPGDPASDAFARSFFERYRRAPTPFHAEVRDGAALLFGALAGVEARDHGARRAVRERLETGGPFAGVTGTLVARGGGRLERSPELLTIERDSIRPRLSEEEETELRRAPGGPR